MITVVALSDILNGEIRERKLCHPISDWPMQVNMILTLQVPREFAIFKRFHHVERELCNMVEGQRNFVRGLSDIASSAVSAGALFINGFLLPHVREL